MVSNESRVGSESGKDTLLDMLRLNRQTGPIASDSCTCARADFIGRQILIHVITDRACGHSERHFFPTLSRSLCYY